MKVTSWRFVVPSLFTFAALCAGLGSILLAAATLGDTGRESSDLFRWAGILVMVSLIFDGFDGTLARVLRGQTSFGAELDTFVDLTSFGIAPALIVYMDFLRDFHAWGIVLFFLFVMSGAARLSRFRVIDPYRGQRGYVGLPITVAASLVAVYWIGKYSYPDDLSFLFVSDAAKWTFWMILFVMLSLQVSLVRYPKPTKNVFIFIPFAITLVLLFFKQTAIYSAILLFIYGMWYAFISPFTFKKFLAHLPPESKPAAPSEKVSR
jgi:CDP-diacylglycerol--serine O-phosphatidyltransferase